MWQVVGYLILAFCGVLVLRAWSRPYLALLLVYVLFPLKQLMGAYIPIFLTVSPLFNFVVFAGVLMAVLSRVLRKDRPAEGMWNSLSIITFVLYGWATLALLWTPGNGVARWTDGYAYWAMQVGMLPLALRSVEDFRRTLIPIMVACIVITGLYFTNPAASWYTGRLTIYIAGRGTEIEARGNSLTIGQMGGLAAIVGALILPLRAGLLVNTVRAGAILTGLGLGLVAGSRAQAVLAVLTMVLFYPMSRRVKSVTQFFGTAGGMGVLLVVSYLGFKLFLGFGAEQSRRWDPSQWWDIIMGRVEDAMVLVRAYGASPQSWVQGLGTNAMSYFANIPMVYAHNAPVEMLCELGLIGISLYITACVLAFRKGRRLFHEFADDPPGRASVAVLLAMCFYLFTLSLKQYTFVAVPEPWFLWVLMAKIATYEHRQGVQAGETGYAELDEYHDEAQVIEPTAA